MGPIGSNKAGRSAEAKAIVAKLPPHRHFVTAYAGDLAVLLAKDPTNYETVNDLDNEIITFWKAMRDHPHELSRLISLTPISRSEYDLAHQGGSRHQVTDLETARRFWVRITQGRRPRIGSRFGGRTGWAHSRTLSPIADLLVGGLNAVGAVAERLQRVALESLPPAELIDYYGRADDGVLVFVEAEPDSDPNAVADNADVATACATAKAPVVIATTAGSCYHTILPGWDSVQLDVPQNADKAAPIMLLANRPISAPDLLSELHWTPSGAA
jgi:DNA adenine methylase